MVFFFGPFFFLCGNRNAKAELCDFRFAEFAFKRHKDVWSAQVAIVFRDFVLEDEMISKRVPGQFREQPVILVRIVAGVGKDQVG